MEGHANGAPGLSEENVILDAKPLRSLAPMFPAPFGYNTFTPPGARPFVCITPLGSSLPGSGSGSEAEFPAFPAPQPTNQRSGVPASMNTSNGAVHFGVPFGSFVSGSEAGFPTFPFPQPTNQRPADPVPVSTCNGAAHVRKDSDANGSSRTKKSSHSAKSLPKTMVLLDGGGDPSLNTPPSASRSKKKRPRQLSSSEVGSPGAEGSSVKRPPKRKHPIMTHEDILALPATSHDARETVEVLLMTFDALRRRLTQLDEIKDIGLSRCPHLKAGTTMTNKDLRANTVKRIGHVPGVEVGDIFYWRVEMCLVGLHAPSVAGIDYTNVRFDNEVDPVALSVVSAGVYENVDGDVDVLIYSGQGGGSGNKSDKKQVDDQKLERGNLALERSLHRANEIRVIRSEKDFSCQSGKIYVYDGVYKIRESWVEKGKSGFSLFKYKLLREPGQPDGIAVWKMTQKWKENPSSRGKVILPDIASGMENIPVCLVNEVDDEKGPSHFTYATKVNYVTPLSSEKPLQACECNSVCLPGDANCSCSQQNGGDLPFSSNGLLVKRKPLIYECNASCKCSVNCRNRVTQKGIKLHFEVFRTKDRGWGLRSWDPIRAGTFICEYIGEVIDKIKVDEDGEEDEYIFHTMHADDKTFNWNYGPELNGDTGFDESTESFKPLPIILSAKRIGNISRFMNHSCSPNVFWQPVMHDHGDDGHPHIMFFAIKHIPPMTELTYDYGMSRAGNGTEEMGSGAGSPSRKKCLCGSPKCGGFFG